jgi:WhiB family redox-sensing transcriptional regulator
MDMEQAACIQAEPSLFFPEGKNKREQEYKAKQVCASCAIVTDCLQFAIDNEQLGIWGGTTEEERRHLSVIIR